MAFHTNTGGVPARGLPAYGWPDYAIPLAGDIAPVYATGPVYAGFVVRSYDGLSLAPMGGVSPISVAEISFDFNGALSATLTLPQNATAARRERLAPNGFPSVWEVDARELGVPFVWQGRVPPVPQWAPTSPEATLQLAPLKNDLANEPVPVQRVESGGVAGYVVREIFDGRTSGVPVLVARVAAGRGAPMPSRGETVLAAMDGLANDRGEFWALTNTPGRVGAILEWHTAPDWRDMTDRVTLTEGVNCEPDLAAVGEVGIDELIGTASSLLSGTGAACMRAFAPAGRVLGMRAALEAEVVSVFAPMPPGSKANVARPDLPNRAALALAIEAELHRRLPRRATASCEITNTGLWSLRPGDLVGTNWPGETTGTFRRAVALITSTTYSLTAPLGMTASLELWEAY